VGALLDGGVPAVELTFTTPGAAQALAESRKVYGNAVLLGAGTIRYPEQVDPAVEAGADYLVTPSLRTDVLQAMLGSGLPAVPGVFTPSEVASALDLGATVVKLFPASTGGVAHLKALRGPFPTLQVIPTGGIDASNLGAWLAAGAMAVGVGGELCASSLLEAENWEEIGRRARQFSAAVQAARRQVETEIGS
jgi:2-dehydro-3-deoxyphosphogluconate aldolase/(4S)-4-hydroxy-2-oxoglutarate aldolase